MATVSDIRISYDNINAGWIASIRSIDKDAPLDITCARYSGNYTIPYTKAQRRKQEYVLEVIKFSQGQRVLDIGSGWGPMLKTIKEKGGEAVGLTLSHSQVAYCERNGWDARLIDWKEYTELQSQSDRRNVTELLNGKQTLDAVISLGAIEHFCSIEEYKQGMQGQIYSELFKLVHELLSKKGRFFLQTMTWGMKGVPDPDKINPYAPCHSDERIIGQILNYFPGSWPPQSQDQILACANPYFKLVESEDGRLDYVETARVWLEAANKAETLRKKLLWVQFIGRSLISKGGIAQGFARIQAVRENAFSNIFSYNLFGHKRLTFEKI